MSRVRLSIPMKQNTRDAIKRLADCTGSSIGSTAGNFLDELADHFFDLADAFELAKTDRQAGIRALQELGLQGQKDLTEEQLKLFQMGRK